MEQILFKASVVLFPALLAVTCHEISHGYVAYKLGDTTAKQLGRLTLNPLKHLEVVGTLMLLLVNIGWAKPVPVNFMNLRHPRRDMILVSIAGPATNFLLAALSGFAMQAIVAASAGVSADSTAQFFLRPIVWNLAFSVYINVLLGLFNLIPIPPLDGGRVLVGLLPPRIAALLARVEPFGMLIIIGIVFAFPGYLFDLIGPPMEVLTGMVAGRQDRLVAEIVNLIHK